MESLFGQEVGRMSLLRRVKRAEMACSPAYRNLSSPTSVGEPGATQARLTKPTGFDDVLFLLLTCRYTKIRQAVIAAIPVFMVNFLLWPYAIDVEPGKMVAKIDRAINANLPIAIWPKCASVLADFDTVRQSEPPEESSCLCIISQDFPQTF